ncbi:MAG: polysaccharide biosynthesis tyrosine autokinase [Ignavibacteria bacterium]|jgi:capsular exopolysaccharide synthesis family protein|nr:polysaccharide biosynthesis tyrosine autokinase [Ignavibacteria bacterium]MCU7512141.1 polysaccharide biosynthesis tyrosine autokinase [Ignavibacteria bacterium]MCU7520446.1 polysaccharide biosynthesis tyrosine autokinase [Ignavibacteria bacterium]
MAKLLKPAPHGKKREEFTLGELFQIINRRKKILFISVIVLVSLAFLYNTLSKPVYEASVMLKKDRGDEKSSANDEFKSLVLLQTQDEIETEMELVKTREVLNSIIDELKLNLSIDKLVEPDGKSVKINSDAVDYNHNFLRKGTPGFMPAFEKVLVKPSEPASSFFIAKTARNTYGIYNAKNDSLLQSSVDTTYLNTGSSQDQALDSLKNEFTSEKHSFVVFNLPGKYFKIDWPEAQVGSRVFFNIGSYNETLDGLGKSINVEHVVKTDIFKISVQSHSPYAAQLIANTAAEKFRSARIGQQKQNIKYSYDFVDKQLSDVSEKLKNAERNLSEFKSAKKLTSIDENSKNLVDFLSSLEAEKIKTDLELTDRETKLAQMQSELKTKGYIDQTYLTPQAEEQSNSPFSGLLKQLSDLEVKRVELLQTRKESHPDVLNLDERIKQIKDKLSTYNKNTLTAYQIIINSAKKKQNELSGLTSKYSGMIKALPPDESRLAELTRQKDVYDKIFKLLLDKREEMRIAEVSKLQDITVLDEAHEPGKPIHPQKALNLGLGLMAGIFIGFIGMTVQEVKSRRLVDADHVENEYDIPIFAIIPNYPREVQKRIENSTHYHERFVTLMPDQEGFRESYRVLQTKLEAKFPGKKILMFTSCEEDTGKTSIVSNFAISLAKANKKVLMIDCDLKKASLTKTFNLKVDSPGLVNFLSDGQTTFNTYQIPLGEEPDNVRNLKILTAGGITEASSSLLGSFKMEQLIDMISSSPFEYVLIDTPPITRVVDVLVLGKFVRDAVLIVRPGKSFKDSVSWGMMEMTDAGINISGILINACDISRSSFKHRYGYGYGYAYGEKGNAKKLSGGTYSKGTKSSYSKGLLKK